MYRNAVKYKDVWLAPGSEGYELYKEREKGKNQKLLDDLVKKCDNDKRKLEGMK